MGEIGEQKIIVWACSFKRLYRYKMWDSLSERGVDQVIEMKELASLRKKSHLVKERMLKELKGMRVEREGLHRGNQKKRKTQIIEWWWGQKLHKGCENSRKMRAGRLGSEVQKRDNVWKLKKAISEYTVLSKRLSSAKIQQQLSHSSRKSGDVPEAISNLLPLLPEGAGRKKWLQLTGIHHAHQIRSLTAGAAVWRENTKNRGRLRAGGRLQSLNEAESLHRTKGKNDEK